MDNRNPRGTRPAPPRAWYTLFPEYNSCGNERFLTVYEDEASTVDTGLVDASGREIHRRVRWPAGFVRFDDKRKR